MSFVYTLLAVSVLLGALYARALRTKNRLSTTDWDHLVRELEELPMYGINRVALDYLQPGRRRIPIRTDEMWFLVGGFDGLKRLQANADVMVELAACAQEWDFEESIFVIEQMRREGLMLRQAVRKIRWSMFFGARGAVGLVHMQKAASAYYLMRQRILVLYKANHLGHYGRLSIALGDPMAACGRAL